MGWKDEERKRVATKREGNKMSLREGTTTIRIHCSKKCLVGSKYQPDADRPLREFRVHYDVGPDKHMVACGMHITAGIPTEDGCEGKGSCWLCQSKIPELLKKKKVLMAEKIGPRERFLVLASEVNEDGEMGAPKPFFPSTGSGIPGKASSKCLATYIHSLLSKSGTYVESPAKGRNIQIEKAATGNTQFPFRFDPPIADTEESKVPAEVLAKLHPLDEFVPAYSKEEQYRTYMGKPQEEEEEVEEEVEEVEEEETVDSDPTDDDVVEESSDDTTEYGEEADPDAEPEPEIDDFSEQPSAEEEIEEEEPEPPPPPKKTAPAKKAAPPETKKATPGKFGKR